MLTVKSLSEKLGLSRDVVKKELSNLSTENQYSVFNYYIQAQSP